MKKVIMILCLILSVVLYAGCSESNPGAEPGRKRKAASVTPTATPSPTPLPTATPTPTPTPTEVPKPEDDKIHTKEYGCTPRQVLYYYMEVGLQPEYAKGQTYNFVKKWEEPILVRVDGYPDEDDWAVMRNLFDRLNTVKGFPGIRECGDGEKPSLVIRFLPKAEYNQYAKEAIGDTATDGYSLIWFRYGVIYDAEIGIVNELSRTNKNHVILEEIVQSLGLQNDSYSYPDSLFYQGYNEPQSPTDLDWLLVRFLYHEKVKPLMEPEEILNVASEVLAD